MSEEYDEFDSLFDEKPKTKKTNEKKKKDNSGLKPSNGYVLTPRQKKDLRFLENMAKQMKKFGKTIPLDEMQELTMFVKENLTDLITAVDHFLRTWNNPNREIKEGGIVDRRNNRMIKIKDFLKRLE